MRRHRLSAILALALALAIPLGVAADDPPAPVSRYLFRTGGVPLAGPVEVVQVVQDYAPDAATPPHTHPGLVVITVVEGAMALRSEGTETTYRVGDSWVEVPGGPVQVATNTGTARATLMITFVLPKGAPLSTAHPGGPQPAPPGPTVRHQFRADAALPAAPYEVAQTVLDFAPGAQTPPHTHPGQVFVTVLAGEATFRTGGTERVYRVGESFIEEPGVVGQAVNAGTAPLAAMVTYLLPKGAPLSTPAAAPGLPATGAGGGGIGPRTLPPAAFLAALSLGGALIVGVGLELRRRRRNA